MRARILEILRRRSTSAPSVRVTPEGIRRLFFFRRGGGEEQEVFYVRDGDDGEDRPLIDVAAISSDTTTSIAWTSASPQGRFVAWGMSRAGSEENTLHVRDVETGADLAERISGTRFASLAWVPDGRSFYYTRYPEPGTVPPGEESYHRRVFHHTLGRDPKDDALVFPVAGITLSRTDSPNVSLSPDGRWLVVRVHRGAERASLYLRDLSKGGAGRWTLVSTNDDRLYAPIPRDDALYVVTNDGAPRSRLIAVEYEHPERWREVIREDEDVLRTVEIAGGVIVAKYLHGAATRLHRFSLDGRALGPIDLPAIGSATVHQGGGSEAFVRFTSFVVPPAVYRVDLESGEAVAWSASADAGLPAPPLQVRVSRIFATSKDGTRVPMFLVERDDRPRAAAAPAFLSGYGGFNRAVSVGFHPCARLAVECGAVWAVAELRGGGEYGDAWHRAGTRERKQNVFDDFIACAEALIGANITSPERLAILGSSNGGLLTAAVSVQRPDLFRAALSDVPLCDMLRYPRFRLARLWISEYGSADDPDQFEALYAYSPYHRVVRGTVYPSMLFVTAESDTRVDPMHARKMVARMQDAQPEDVRRTRPILLRMEAGAGHGAGKPVTKLADEFADQMAFFFDALRCTGA